MTRDRGARCLAADRIWFSSAASSEIKVSLPEKGGFWEIPVLYQDADLLALNKPAGPPSSPGPDVVGGADLTSLLHKGIAGRKPWALELSLDYLANAHRLDAGTTGVLLFARSKETASKLADLFGADQVHLDHLVLVQGEPTWQTCEIDEKIGPDPATPGRMRIARSGKTARTSCEVIERFSGWTVLRCRPAGNRLHQLRVHLRSAGLPIVGDSLYGGRPLLLSRVKPGYRPKRGGPEKPIVASAAVHLEALTMPYPGSAAGLAITAPLPKELAVALKYLRRFAPKSTEPPQ